MPDRKPGIFGALTPRFKSSDILHWLSEQNGRTRSEPKSTPSGAQRRKIARGGGGVRKIARTGRSPEGIPQRKRSRASSSHGRSTSASMDEKQRKRLKFLLMAKEHPGVVFASTAANTRAVLGQLGVELDIGPQGPVFRKWWDTSFTKKHSHAQLQPYWDEMQLLITALDEFHAGRIVEVGDILASRLRMLTVGLDKGTWGVARRYLVYHNQDLSLVSDELLDEALKIDAMEKKRDRALLAAKDTRGDGARR